MLVKEGLADVVLEVLRSGTSDEDILMVWLNVLRYMCESRESMVFLVMDLGVVPLVLRVMRRFDYNISLLQRCFTFLRGLISDDPGAAQIVLGSGAPQVLLSALDVHRGAGEEYLHLTATCLACLTQGEGPQVVKAAKQMRSVSTLALVARQLENCPKLLLLALAVLNRWSETDSVLRHQVAKQCSLLVY